MRRKDFKLAVVCGMTANGLSVVRSLGRRGIPVIGIDSDPKQPGFYSRYCRAFVCPSAIGQEQEFIDYLIDTGERRQGKSVLFATADEYVLSISKNRQVLSKYYDFRYPEHELVASFLNKEKTCALANTHGIAHPATYFATDEEDISEIAQKVSYPCILKPRFSHIWSKKYGGKKVIVANSADELIEGFRVVSDNELEVIIQQIVNGPDSNVYVFMAYFDKESKPNAVFCCRKINQ